MSMPEISFIVGVGTLLVGTMTLIVGILTLRSGRRSAELAESRNEYLREEKERLEFYRQERLYLEEALKQERQERLEAQRKVDRLETEREKLRDAQQERTLRRPQEDTENQQVGERIKVWWRRRRR